MSQISKFINLLIQYGQKIESHIHKKYRPFVRSTLNLQSLAKNTNDTRKNQIDKSINQKSVHLTTQIIVLRLGLQSKSTKCVQISLQYLYKMFDMKFIDLHVPNYCQNFIIQEDGVRHRIVQKYQKQLRHQLVRLLQPLVHFKSNEINQLLLKNFEHLIGQEVLQPIVQICYSIPNDSGYNSLCSYFNYRAYLYEEFCQYSANELNVRANLILGGNQKLQIQLKRALDRNQKFTNLIEKYIEEGITKQIVKDGGKHGFCVMCGQVANHFCKTTKVSLCGVDCKKAHIELAQKFYKQHFQSCILEGQLIRGLTYLLECLYRKQSTLIMNVAIYILQHNSLFYILKNRFRNIFKKYVPKVMSKLYDSKNQSIFSNIYTLMGNIIINYNVECFSEVQYFFKTSIIKVLEDKKPKYNILMLVFKNLSKIFQNGKTVIELYVNYDCEINQENVIEKILFELAKISQDKHSNSAAFKTQQKLMIKNSAITLFIILIKALNQYRNNYPKVSKAIIKQQSQTIDAILMRKQRKISLQKFVNKFNEDWSNGLKALFNMGLVGLESQEEITEIIMICKGLKKDNIDLMMFSEPGKVYFKSFIKRIKERNKGIFSQFIQYFRYLPLKKASIGCKIFTQEFSHEQNLSENIQKWINSIQNMKSYDDFKLLLASLTQVFHIPQQKNMESSQKLYLLALQTKEQLTMGGHQHMFMHCSSRQFTSVLQSQISLFQIPISYLLQTSYDVQRVLNLIHQLVQACPHTNWLSMLIKNSFNDLSDSKNVVFDAESIKIIKAVLDSIKNNAEHLSDWTTLLGFIKNLHFIVISSARKGVPDAKANLISEISVVTLEKSLIGASQMLTTNFSKFMNNMLVIAKEDIIKFQRPFMLQKYFQILENNIFKYLKDFSHIFEQFAGFTKQIPQASTETLIYIADMIKQSFTKVLKKQQNFGVSCQKNDEIQKAYFEVIQIVLNKRNKEVGQFMMNCFSMIIVHHFQFSKNSWIIIFDIMKKRTKEYRNQVHMISQKMLAQKMKGCSEFKTELIEICLLLVDQKEQRTSIESIHSVKKLLEIMSKQKSRDTDQSLKEIYQSTIVRLVSFVRCQCHESVIEMIFLLMQARVERYDENNGNTTVEALFRQYHYQKIFASIFEELENLPQQFLQRGEKIMNQSLYWSVKHKNYSIIGNLQKTIIGKYGPFSITAMKCIKTFIQMVNPRERNDWETIENTLVRIMTDTQLTWLLEENSQEKAREENSKEQLIQKIDIQILSRKLITQKMAIQLLPNDSSSIEQVRNLYDQAIGFNDNIQLRCKLWSKGLGKKGSIPPNILSLQEVISNRILAIYNSTQDYQEMYQFGFKILARYQEASLKIANLKSNQVKKKIYDISNKEYQLYEISKNYWQIRRVPLQKIIMFLLPKAGKFCIGQGNVKIKKQAFIKSVIHILPYVQKRQSYLKSIQQLTGVFRREQVVAK